MNGTNIWKQLMSDTLSERWLHMTMSRVARALSDMVEEPIHHHHSTIERVPLTEVITHAGDPEQEMIGVYLLMQGELEGQAIIVLSMESAMNFVDLLMGTPLGTSTGLGEVERSALGEIGNMTVAAFLNAAALLAGAPRTLRPSPPAVMVDMLGAILDVVVTPVAALQDDLLIVETFFTDNERAIDSRLWLLPDPLALQEIEALSIS